jgi:predicted nucleic acid-binding protein
MLRIYLEHTICSAITRRFKTWPRAELDAIDHLLAAGSTGTIHLLVSRQSFREFERAPASRQPDLKKGISGIEVIENDHHILEMYTQADPYGGCIINPLITDIVDEKVYAALSAAGLKDDDAKHLMYAVHNNCGRFVTRDKHFLNRRPVLERFLPTIKIRKPSEMIAELSTSSGSGG